jgi:hypothetical protein
MKIKIIFFLSILLGASISPCIGSEECKKICGTVELEGKPLSGAKIKLYEAFAEDSKLIEKSHTDSFGNYHFTFQTKKGALLYLLVHDPSRPEIVLTAAFEVEDSSRKVIVNELTTVASVYALSQFIELNKIFGPSPGIVNAVRTVGNLVNLCHGEPGKVISNNQNGAHGIRSTRALRIQNSLANLISGCASDPQLCAALFATVSQNGKPVNNTLEAIHRIARNPFLQDNDTLFALSIQNEVFTPALENVPSGWAIALHFVQGGFSAPGRMAFDSKGNVWSNNNWLPPAGSAANIPGRQVTVLNPLGKPILGSPIFSNFVKGSGYGIAIDQSDHTWIISFHSGKAAKFNRHGEVVLHSKGLDHPSGTAIDQCGNVWSANFGHPEDQNDPGSVSVFIGGDPNNVVEQKVGIFKPFSVAIDDEGRCWACNGGFTSAGSITILKLTRNNKIKIFKKELTPVNGVIASPKTIAIDAHGNGWVSNFEIPEVTFIDGKTFEVTNFPVDPRSRGWGLAVDGGGLIWDASFTNPLTGAFKIPPVVSVVSGKKNNLGEFLYSFTNPALQHITGLQIDSSGNIWMANNWGLKSTAPSPIFSGDGLVEFIGLTTPVVTPLIGQPVNPADLLKKPKHRQTEE